MSTRCQIEFSAKGEYEDSRTHKIEKYNEGKILIYRHSDGYPDEIWGVVESLKRFFKWICNRNDLEYMTANFILFEKLSAIANSNQWAKNNKENNKEYYKVKTIESILESNDDNNANWLLGYGICQPKNIHSDIDYFYNVEIYNKCGKKTITIKVRNSPKGKIIESHEIKINE